MTKAAIIRCEKNENRCPLTGCFKSLVESTEGFQNYPECMPGGIFTCRCPGDDLVNLGKILKSKGVDAIHFCTCTFANKTAGGWVLDGGGFCDHIDDIMARVHEATGLPCVKGTAHLPAGYQPVTIG